MIAKGTRLGPYELATLLGEGGMGQVYRARDTRLDRTVAIKVLSARFGSSPDRRARFEREARLISSLSHPNICALFDVGREGETDFLVMEYIEGETLATRLVRGPLPLDLVLRFGTQIAAALDRAHRQDIVHRDLKPGNILVTPSGVKVLDFGLAKIQAGPARDPPPESLGGTQTGLTPALTVEGTVLGTPHYMAPEQFEGRDVDARADLWAFGCVLYEMVTGRRPFDGASSSASIAAAVFATEPERPSVRVSGVPPALERLILNCLIKDRDQRWQSALDARLELDAIAATGNEPVRPTATLRRRIVPWVASLVLAAAATGAGLWLGHRRATPPTRATVRFEVAPPTGTTFLGASVEVLSIAVSPDGGRIAFVAVDPQGRKVWQRRVDQLEARPISGTEGASSIFWSPDGKSLAFFALGKLRRIDLDGGSPVPICDVSAGIGYSGSWSPAGTILYSSVQGEAIYGVPATGGVPKRVAEPNASRHEGRLVWPEFLPDGSGYLYSARTADKGFALMFVDGDAPPRLVTYLASRVAFIAPDWLAFARDGALLAQRFDRVTGQLTGAAMSIAPKVRVFVSTAWAGFAASPSGSIVVLSAQNSGRLVWLDRSGTPQGTVGAPGNYLNVSISPDGRSLLADRSQPELGTYDIWKVDLERDIETRVTNDPEADFDPIWLPGTRAMAYSTIKGNENPNIWRRDLDTGAEEPLLPRHAFESATDASSDGRLLAFVQRESGKFRAWILELGGQHAATPLLQSDAQVATVRFSPDARYVAFISDESGADEAYVAPLARPREAVRISRHGATRLRWRHDGREILFVGGDRFMTAVAVQTDPRLVIGQPEPLFALPANVEWNEFDVTPDGRRLIAITIDRMASVEPATAVVGWTPGAPLIPNWASTER